MSARDKKAEIFLINLMLKATMTSSITPDTKKITAHLVKKLKSQKVKTVLDMGCGSGAFTSRLAQALPKSKVIGINISPGCIKRAKKDYTSLSFEVCDIR